MEMYKFVIAPDMKILRVLWKAGQGYPNGELEASVVVKNTLIPRQVHVGMLLTSPPHPLPSS